MKNENNNCNEEQEIEKKIKIYFEDCAYYKQIYKELYEIYRSYRSSLADFEGQKDYFEQLKDSLIKNIEKEITEVEGLVILMKESKARYSEAYRIYVDLSILKATVTKEISFENARSVSGFS